MQDHFFAVEDILAAYWEELEYTIPPQHYSDYTTESSSTNRSVTRKGYRISVVVQNWKGPIYTIGDRGWIRRVDYEGNEIDTRLHCSAVYPDRSVFVSDIVLLAEE